MHTYTLSKRINLCSMFIAYFAPGIHDEFLWRVVEEGKNHIQMKPNITLPVQCHFKSQIKAK